MTAEQRMTLKLIDQLCKKQLSIQEAAMALHLSTRQVYRKKKEFLKNGDSSIIHKNTGRAPIHKFDEELVERIVSIYSTELKGYNFSHAQEILEQEYGISISRPSLHRILIKAGFPSPKKKKKPKKHTRRPRRNSEGELAQIDASPYDWLNNGQMLHLHGAIDDATSKVLFLQLGTSETYENYRQGILYMNAQNTLPQCFYSDKSRIFVHPKPNDVTDAEALAGIRYRRTNFTQALFEMGIQLIPAHSPQAKGRIERLWNTLQDRLPKKFQRLGITTLEEANHYLQEQYLEEHNRKFAVEAQSANLSYVNSLSQEFLKILFGLRSYRVLDQGLSFKYQSQIYTFSREDIKKAQVKPRLPVLLSDNSDSGLHVLFPEQKLIIRAIPISAKRNISQKKSHSKPIRKNYTPEKLGFLQSIRWTEYSNG